MFKKSRIFAMSLCCAALAMGAVSCADDSSNSKDEKNVSYSLTVTSADASASCNGSACTVSVEVGKSVSFTVGVAQVEDSVSSIVPNVPVTVTSDSQSVSVQNAGQTATVQTGANGTATVFVTAGTEKGQATVSIATGADYGSLKGSIFVTVTKKDDVIIEEDVCKKYSCNDETSADFSYGNCVYYKCIEPKTNDTYTAKLKYNGGLAVNSAEAFIFSGKTCSSLISAADLDKAAIADLDVNYSEYLGQAYNKNGIDGEEISATMPTLEGTYAVIARGSIAGEYVVYGCEDGLSASKKSVTVSLKNASDAINEQGETCEDLNCPAELTTIQMNDTYSKCILKGCVDPYVPSGKYTGAFALQSQFNALSLLPHAAVEPGKKPKFQEMLVGDWIEWSLDLLKDPGTAIPDILVDQVLDVLLTADWLTDFLTSINLTFITPELIQTLLNSLNLKQLATDYINEFLGQYEWWSVTSSALTILDQLTRDFTMAGTIYVVSEPDSTTHKTAATNVHSYDTLLYNGAKFDKCYVGDEYGQDASGNRICGIPLGSIDKNIGSVRGYFAAEYSDCTGDTCNLVDITEHNVSFAYGTIIYSTIMYMLPKIIGNDLAEVKTFGGLIEYYAGFLLVKAWNATVAKINEEIEAYNTEHASDEDFVAKTPRTDTIEEGSVTMCAAVGAAGANFIAYLLTEKLNLSSMEGIIKNFVSASTLTPLCKTGVNKLDALIDTQIAKLEASTDQISFKTASSCDLKRDIGTQDVTAFGTENYTWGQATDNRCSWDLAIKAINKSISGKFFAVRNND